MKTFWVVILTMLMLFSLSIYSMAAMIPIKADCDLDFLFPIFSGTLIEQAYGFNASFDHWYTISPNSKKVIVDYFGISNLNILDVIYQQNDQMYAKVNNLSSSSSTTVASGSYLFDFGLFAGAMCLNSGGSTTTFMFPGYRYSFSDDSYIALKADFNEGEVMDYLLSGKFYTNKMYLHGQIALPNDFATEEANVGLGVNYQFTGSFTTGLSFLRFMGYNTWEAGFTWDGIADNKLVIDASVGQSLGEVTYYTLSSMYQLTEDLQIGTQYDGAGEGGTYSGFSVKSQYKLEDSRLGFRYSFFHDAVPPTMSMVYEMKFN